MKLIVGLGNPGKEYEKTRHNVGFMVLEQILKNFESAANTAWIDNKKFKSDIAEFEWQRKHGEPEKVILAKPKTFMNNSGMAVKLLKDFYKVNIGDIWIIHDDVDFPVGTLRIRLGGASAGHRGVLSVIESLGDDKFWRFRVGIGRPGEANHSGVEHHVLDMFSHQDHSKMREVIKNAAKAVELGLEHDLMASMNKYNTK